MVPAGLLAWGPSDRPTYSGNTPAPRVTFNSMVDTPYGDERNFVRIKEAGAANSTYTDNIKLQPGKEYQVMVYYHNNASETLNSAEHNYRGIAQNARMSVQMPQTVKAGERARITGTVRADNATPKSVWDEAWGTPDTNVELRYIYDSAVIRSNGAVDGQKLPNSLYTPEGAQLGYDSLNGQLKGCYEYSGYVTFRIKVHKPSFQIAKEVTKQGGKEFHESINAKVGDKVDFRIAYRNNGTTQQNNVVIKDALPKGLSYDKGSALIASSASNGQYAKTDDTVISARGINIGHYAPNGNAFFKFTATVTGEGLDCGLNRLVNKATVETNNGSKSDTAEVIVKKVCEDKPEVKKIKVCLVNSKSIVTIDENDFNSSIHSNDLSDCEEVPVTPEEPETPTEVPTELPETGLSRGLATIIGLASIAAGAGYLYTGRHASQTN